MCVMLLFVQVVRVVLLGKIPVRPPRGAQVTAQLANMTGDTYRLSNLPRRKSRDITAPELCGGMGGGAITSYKNHFTFHQNLL